MLKRHHFFNANRSTAISVKIIVVTAAVGPFGNVATFHINARAVATKKDSSLTIAAPIRTITPSKITPSNSSQNERALGLTRRLLREKGYDFERPHRWLPL